MQNPPSQQFQEQQNQNNQYYHGVQQNQWNPNQQQYIQNCPQTVYSQCPQQSQFLNTYHPSQQANNIYQTYPSYHQNQNYNYPQNQQTNNYQYQNIYYPTPNDNRTKFQYNQSNYNQQQLQQQQIQPSEYNYQQQTYQQFSQQILPLIQSGLSNLIQIHGGNHQFPQRENSQSYTQPLPFQQNNITNNPLKNNVPKLNENLGNIITSCINYPNQNYELQQNSETRLGPSKNIIQSNINFQEQITAQNNFSQKINLKENSFVQNYKEQQGSKQHKNRKKESRERNRNKSSNKQDLQVFYNFKQDKKYEPSKYSKKKLSKQNEFSSKSSSPTPNFPQSVKYKNERNNKNKYSRCSSSESASSFNSRGNKAYKKQSKLTKNKKQQLHPQTLIVSSSNSLNFQNEVKKSSLVNNDNLKISSQNNIDEKNIKFTKNIHQFEGENISNILINSPFKENPNQIDCCQEHNTLNININQNLSKNLQVFKNTNEIIQITSIKQGQKSDSAQVVSQDEQFKNISDQSIEFKLKKKEVPKLRIDKLKTNLLSKHEDDINNNSDNQGNLSNKPVLCHHKESANNLNHENKVPKVQLILPPSIKQQINSLKNPTQKSDQTEKPIQKVTFSLDHNQLTNQETNNQNSQSQSLRKLQNSQMFFYNILGQDQRGYTQTTYLQNKIKNISEEKEGVPNSQLQSINDLQPQLEQNNDIKQDDIIGSGMNQNRYFCDKKGQICFKCGKSGHVRNNCIDSEEKDICTFCLSYHDMAKCKQTVCFKCGEIGHEKKHCPQTNGENGSYNQQYSKRFLKCNHCSKIGHRQYICGLIKPIYHIQRLGFSCFSNKVDESILTCIVCRQNGHKNCYNNITLSDSLYSVQLPLQKKKQCYKPYINDIPKTDETNQTSFDKQDQTNEMQSLESISDDTIELEKEEQKIQKNIEQSFIEQEVNSLRVRSNEIQQIEDDFQQNNNNHLRMNKIIQQ